MTHTINRQRNTDLRKLHEMNYHLVTNLLPNLREMPDSAVSSVPGVSDLHLRIIERSPYTTVLSLTHEFSAGAVTLPAPDLWLRVYHDARVAEAIAHQDGASPAHARTYTWHKGLDTDIKWQLNTFMEKWLKHCLESGHSFSADESYSSTLSV